MLTLFWLGCDPALAEQSGFRARRLADRLSIDALFAGTLTIEARFVPSER